MKILLIRHGETTGDIENRYGGAYDDHLTELGRQQLSVTAANLEGTKVDTMYHSTLIRAKESAEIINQILETELIEISGFRERDYGVLGGLTKDEALKMYPEAVEAHKNPLNTDPEGESQADFTQRVLAAFEEVKKSNQSTVIILAHGGSLKVIIKHLNQPVPPSIGDGEIIEVTI
jgi:broad specificity phosphatase PhoE